MDAIPPHESGCLAQLLETTTHAVGGGYEVCLVVSAGLSLALGVLGENCWVLPSLTHALALE